MNAPGVPVSLVAGRELDSGAVTIVADDVRITMSDKGAAQLRDALAGLVDASSAPSPVERLVKNDQPPRWNCACGLNGIEGAGRCPNCGIPRPRPDVVVFDRDAWRALTKRCGLVEDSTPLDVERLVEGLHEAFARAQADSVAQSARADTLATKLAECDERRGYLQDCIDRCVDCRSLGKDGLAERVRRNLVRHLEAQVFLVADSSRDGLCKAISIANALTNAELTKAPA